MTDRAGRPRHTRPWGCLLALPWLCAACADSTAPASSPAACTVSAPGTVARLSAAEVEGILAAAAEEAQRLLSPAVIAVLDREGEVLGVLRMEGGPTGVRFVGRGQGVLERLPEPLPAVAELAISKAGTAAYLSSQGHAFSTRTASFIVQQHFPPKIRFAEGGPLFGVQLSQLRCGDVLRRLDDGTEGSARAAPARLPIGLAGDPGGLPLYKDGALAGGIGVEQDGIASIDFDPEDDDAPVEERIAAAGAAAFFAPRCIQASEILVNGIRLPFRNLDPPEPRPAPPLASVPGSVIPVPGFFRGAIVAAPPSRFTRATLGGIAGETSSSYPPRSGRVLSEEAVRGILARAAQQADRTRAGIRIPLGDAARVNIAVVDVDGRVLGVFRTLDAPVFGFDVAIQKARTSAWFSASEARARLREALPVGAPDYGARASADGVALDGSIAFSTRALGFLARPFYPDGIDGSEPGPFSRAEGDWSVFNTGMQLDLVLERALGDAASCSRSSGLANGAQIFAGGIPLYLDGRLAGAIGVSGDGIDQDDYIAAAGAVGFAGLPAGVRRPDELLVRGTRLPDVKFPAHPER